jgi:HlyD family secretion protein
MKKLIIRILGPVVVFAMAWYGYRLFQMLPQRQEQVAVTKVRRGDVVIRAFSRGELRAIRSITLTAPNLFSTVQVTRLAPAGALAKEKDLIVEFDDSERRAALEEDLLAVEQTDEQIRKAKADLAIRDSQDEVDLLRARFGVRRAELEVQRNPILAEIDRKKNLLNLEEARRKLQQLETDIKSRKAQAQAELDVLYQSRNKTQIYVAEEKQRIAQAKVLSPMTGLVAVKQNRTGYFIFGQQLPDIREGDTLQPGIPVADILDLSELEVVAKVGELDRANLHEGQNVLITLDAMPEKKIRGTIKSMSGTASSNVTMGDPAKKFDVVFGIDMRQLLAELGVRPADIQRIMNTAEQNARKAPPVPAGVSMASLLTAPALQPPGAPSGGPPNAPGNAPAAGSAAAARPARNERLSGAAAVMQVAQRNSQFSEADRENAKLPPPPEEDTGLDVLLRPGLLADVEIIVEKIPNALYVPVQAVFEKGGKPIVWVRKGSRFEDRVVSISRQSESTMVLSGGVSPGDSVALADPYAKKGSKKSSDGKKGGANPAMPAGGGAK